jgi:hypothetical protein
VDVVDSCSREVKQARMDELRRSRATWMMGLALAAGCGRGGGGDDVCHAAAELCGASGDFDEDDCTGDEREFAECLVERGDCDPLTAAECAGGGVDGPDGGTSPGGSIELSIVELAPSIDRLDVTVEIRNVSVSEPIPVSPSLFLLEDDAHNLHVSLGGVCDGGDFLAEGGREECQLQYPIEKAEPVQIVYRDLAGRTATASLAGECALQPEATLDACTDKCSNDGDEFIDCEDFDCCDVPGLDCPPDTACSEPSCLPGPEDNLPLCTDECSNDDDTFIDCEDFDCCDVPGLDCPPTSACGMRGLR